MAPFCSTVVRTTWLPLNITPYFFKMSQLLFLTARVQNHVEARRGRNEKICHGNTATLLFLMTWKRPPETRWCKTRTVRRRLESILNRF